METSVWYCDVCGEEITSQSNGLVTWKHDTGKGKGEFEIVHKGPSCDLDRGKMSMDLFAMTNDEGQARLLAFLSYGPLPEREGAPRIADLDEFVELFRRLQTPGYEEARRYFDLPEVRDEFSGSSEIAAYSNASLEWIVKTGRRVLAE